MPKPFLSIIIPTFNSEKTLVKCLESITNQTFGDYELILVDGRSTDATLEIIKTYSLKCPAIRWISENDLGIYDAMNKGIKMAKGEWIYFIGSDDTLYNTLVLKNIHSAISGNAGIEVLYGNVYSSRFGGIYDGAFTCEKIFHKNISHQAIFFKRTVFAKIGSFNIKYKSHADWDHNLKWFLPGKIKHQFINITVANYADGGFSSTNFEVFFKNVKEWEYSLLLKKQIGFKDKLRIAKREFVKAIKEKRRRDALSIILHTPSFLL